MSVPPDRMEGEDNQTGLRPGSRPVVAGVVVRDEDFEPKKGFHFTAIVVRVSAVIILLLAIWQFVAWWMDRPPGGVGVGLLVADTIRLIVLAGLLWSAGELADLMIATHYDIRAARILLARQTYTLRQLRIELVGLTGEEGEGDRRTGGRSADVDPRAGPET
jgi:hypothetical protein